MDWVRDSIFLFHFVFIVLTFSTFVGSVWSFEFFIPATTANDLQLSIPDLIHYIYFPILILEKEPVFSFWMFKCSVLNKWSTGTIFITSLVWRGPWLGIEPGTSRTQSQHSTIRLSRRRWFNYWEWLACSLNELAIFNIYQIWISLQYGTRR